MRISNAQIEKVFELHLNRVHSAQDGSGGGAAAKPDELILSTKATDMEQAKQKAAGLPEIRAGVVHQLKQKIQAGGYVAGDEDLAQAIIRSVLPEESRL